MSKYGARPGQGGGQSGGGLGGLLKGLVAIAVVAGICYLGYRYWIGGAATATDAETGCLTNVPAPQAALIMVDATDRLSRENSERISSRIHDVVGGLERYSRVIILPFGGDTAAPLQPIFDGCVPGRPSDARWDEGGQLLAEPYRRFQHELQALVTRLQQIPDSHSSPITEQIVRAASDPQLHWQGSMRTLVLTTDGLESSIYWTRNLRLPDPPDSLLRDVRVEYFEIGNTRGNRLQTREMRLEWKSWLERAGADVRISAPGFSANPQ